ncbi:MAG: ABC transporter permease [Gemmatimonadota bacterium]|nr:MAG: ABC transporter permease [Gemmatimonadota bacterium]
MARWLRILSTTLDNLSFAARGLLRSPGFTATVVVTLALGIGVNATMFGIVDRLLLSTPPQVREADQVRRLYTHLRDRASGPMIHERAHAYLDFTDWQEARSFASVSAYWDNEMTLGRGVDAVRLNVGLASASFFGLLGVEPALGRFFDESEDRTGAAGVAVLSYGLWQAQFGGDPSVLGRMLDIGRGSYTVIGVAPRGFSGLDLKQIDLWAPLHAFSVQSNTDRWKRTRNFYWIKVIARLAPGVSVEAAENEATRLHRNGRRDEIDQGRYDENVRVVVAPLVESRGPVASRESKVSVLLAGVSLVVLLIACANVANLLLARSLRRRKEIAVRLALGISHSRLTGMLLTESIVLAVVGAVAALHVASWGAGFIRHTLLPDLAWTDSPVGSRVLAFTAVLALVTGIVSGIVPALQARCPDLVSDLKTTARAGTVRRSRTRVALLVTQGTLSAVLLVGAGLFVRSLQRLEGLDLGLDPQAVVYAQLELQPRDRTTEEVDGIYQRSLGRLRALPAVEYASTSGGLPFWGASLGDVYVPGLDSVAAPPPGPHMDRVTPDYFATLGIAIRRGRDFDERDAVGAEPVAIVNESMARGLWGDEPLDRCLLIESPDAPCTRVVGVVEDSHRMYLTETRKWVFYLPAAQSPAGSPSAILLRVRGDAERLAPVVQRELLAGDPDIRYAVVRPLQERIDPQLRSYRLGATMFGLFGLLALIVAAFGLYSVLAFNVAQRTHEIGVRNALGATRGRIVTLVLKESVGLAAIGIALGLVIAVAAAGTLAPLLYEISPRDPLVLIVVTVTLLLAATAAGLLPASRAARIDPNAALRVE